MHPEIIPECWADTLLMTTLGYVEPNHQQGVGQVNNVIEKDYKDKIAIGIVDKDKKQPSNFDKYKEVEKKHGLILKKKAKSQHYLIMVTPAIDNWIESVGNAHKIKRPYKNNDREYRKQMKSMNLNRNKEIKSYFNTIKQKNPSAFKTIKNWIANVKSGKI